MESRDLALGIILGVLISGLVLMFFFKIVPEETIETLEVCEGVSIGVAKEGSCYAGCVQYEGKFVNYPSLKYLQEFCEEISSNSSKEKLK